MGATVTGSQGVMAAGPPQSDYNTGVTPATAPANFRQIIAANFIEVPEFSSPNVGNQGEATGSPYSTKNNKGRDDASGSFDQYLSFNDLGFWAFRTFGDYSVSLVTAGVYKHIFKLLNPQLARVLAAWELAVKLNEAALSSNEIYNKKFRGCIVESASFSTPKSEEKPYLMANVAWHGSGKRSAGDVKFFGASKHVVGTGTGELAQDAENRIPENGTMNLYSQPAKAGTTYAAGCDFYSFNATINNNLNLAIGYSCAKFQTDNDPTTGQIRGSLPITEQTASVEFQAMLTPELKAAADFEALRSAGTSISADWTFLGKLISGVHYNKAIFSLNKFTIGGIGYPTLDDVRGIQISAQPEAVSSIMPLELELTTAVPDYSVFIGT